MKLLYQIRMMLEERLPSLNSWQVENLALFGYAVINAESSQQGAIARQAVCGERVDSAARRWRRYLDNPRFPLEAFFVEWVRWVVSRLEVQELTLLVDETKLGQQVGVMLVGVAWQGRCLPLVWRAYAANTAEGYPPEGQVGLIEALLQLVKRGLPDGVKVLVLADRGIGTSPALCRCVERLGWSYLFRVTAQTKIITDQGELTIAAQVQPGHIWQAQGLVFKRRGRIPAYARARWAQGQPEPWALVTNDPTLTGYEYARRNWQEQSFRDLKSGGWHWNDSRLRHPDHVARLLVVLAFSYAWLVALGSQAVAWGYAQPLIRRADGTLRRTWSLFREGLRFFVEYVQRYGICLDLHFIPDHRFT